MPSLPNTDRALASLRVVARTDFFDPKTPGLMLRVTPSGRKTWSLSYRFHGERRRLSLGKYSRVGLADARTAAAKALRRVDLGEDPRAAREAAKAAAQHAKQNSIEALCVAYIARHAKQRKRTWRDDQSKLKCEVLPHWKRRAVTSITRRDCRELIQAIADRGGQMIYANRVVALLSRLFRFAMDEDIITANPAAHLPKPGVEAQARPEGEREQKAYSADEIRQIWKNTETFSPILGAVYRLGLVTAQRPSEISNLEWSELLGQWWRIPSARTKNGLTQRVYLTPLALEILGDVPRINERYVFAGFRGKRQLSEANARAFAGVRRRIKPRHALRDTVATGLAGRGVHEADIAKVLNHAYGPKVTRVYNEYRYDKEKRRALTKWARALMDIIEERPTQKVVAIEAVRQRS